jgi:hypothetical protein
MLLERGAGIDSRSYIDETPLHVAVRFVRIEVVRLFLEHGADVQARNNSGITPSQYARQMLTAGYLSSEEFTGLQEIIELLSEYGGNSVE